MAVKNIVIVDDSFGYQRLLVDIIESHPELRVAGVAPNGKVALEMMGDMQPHLITLDILMPEMDGIQTLMELKRRWPTVRTIMFSSLSADGSEAALDALALGASDYAVKPEISRDGDSISQALQNELMPKIEALLDLAPVQEPTGSIVHPIGETSSWSKDTRSARLAPVPKIVVIGVSTGGPNALMKLLMQLPADLPVPVCIVQHMPAEFTAKLASRLNAACAVTVREARHGEPVFAGTVYIAPGGFHMVLERTKHTVAVTLNDNDPENSCRPSVDPLFRSAAKVYGDKVLGVVMTGMGQDGLNGSEVLNKAGSTVIVQDEESCIVWGMPKLVSLAGLAAEEVPLSQLAGNILGRIKPPAVSTVTGRSDARRKAANSSSHAMPRSSGRGT